MSNKEILKVENIVKHYPGVLALNNVSCSFYEGEIHALLGENGAGKSTLIKILSGAIQADSGSISIGDEVFHSLSPDRAQGLGVGVIYQEFNLVPQLTVYENIFLGHEYKNGLFVNKKKMKEAADKILKSLRMDLDSSILVKDLSIAYQQIVEIAKAVSRDVRVLIMDEPTAPLTQNEVDALFDLVKHLRSKGVTIIYISHRIEELFEISDRVSVFRDGTYIDTVITKDSQRSQLIDMMVGRKLIEEFPEKKYAICDEILEVHNLNQGSRLKDINFSLCRGEILGFAGLVGAGRTELARVIFGADQYDNGELIIDNKSVEIKKTSDAIAKGVVLIPEDRKLQGLLLELSVKHNISIPNLKNISKTIFIDKKRDSQIADEYISALRIKTPNKDQIVKNLSGGNQQKVVIAKWMATNSKIMIFDEPTRGIDVGAKQEIYMLMHKLAEEGMGIIMISSEMPELLGMSDRILVMREGRIVKEFTKEEATQNKILEAAAGGGDE
ncbi:MAG: D-xylose ABC transporter ATP-binding protein [Spirochaetaceae bacterium 4572_59]|nr:MAG: D-xylose ABC transporter ATP-binding protein [Spirochaetaceae bacterium 4572_59]